MTKLKKLVMFIFVAFFLDDMCRYIKGITMLNFGAYKHFSFIYTAFENNRVYNLSLIYFSIVVIGYFFTHFFDTEKNYLK